MLKIIPFLLALSLFFSGCSGGNNDSSFEPANNPPIINDLNIETLNNQTLNISLANYDLEGDLIVYELTSSPSNGVASFSENILSYAPNINFTGIDSFTYRAYDGNSYSEVKNVLVTSSININNTKPVVADLNINTNKNIEVVYVLPIEDLDNDILRYSISSAPSNGSVSFHSNVLIYTPNNDYYGNDSFTFVANDGLVDSDLITANVTINNENNAPIIYSGTIPEGTEGTSYSYSIPVEDPDGDAISISLEVVDSLGNSIATPSWITIDSANGSFSTTNIDINSDAIIYFKITATDIFGASSSSVKAWNIINYSPFTLTWKTDNFGDSDDNTVAFYAELNPNNIIDWGDGVIENNLQNGVLSHTYAIAGEYSVSIVGAKIVEAYGHHGGPVNYRKIMSIDNWGASSWISMENMFRGASNVVMNATDTPNTSNVVDMGYMFNGATSFNGDISGWDVGNVKYMDYMFSSASSFNQDLGNWDVGNVLDMQYMFYDTAFNQDISAWDVSQVKNMTYMFFSTPFNQPIGNWNVSNVTSLAYMFYNCVFNQPIGNWDVSNVTSLTYTFRGSHFNQDINNWDVSNVKSLHYTFSASYFNQPLDNWDVSSVTVFDSAFRYSSTQFTGDISGWDVSSGIDFDYMFNGNTNFDQDISAWAPINATTMLGFLSSSSFSTANYDLLLNAWAILPLQSGVSFSASTTNYTIATSDAARNDIITNFSWVITDAGGI